MSGTVYLVGAGPGATDLLTLRAARLLERADIVFYDALVSAEIVALATRAAKIAVGKRCGMQSTAQRFINKRLIDAALAHAVVVRLKGGDPMLFGRAHEEITALEAAGICCEVVPGVTAALAASAELGASLTRRGVARSVTFVTPRVGVGETPSNWAKSIAAADTGVIYMGAGQAKAIAAALIEAGMPASTPVAIVRDASLPHSYAFHSTLVDLPRAGAGVSASPALILVGTQFRARRRASRTASAAEIVDARAVALG